MALILTTFQKYQRDLALKKYAAQGLGANRTIEKLKEIGLPMRRQDALRVYREYAKIPERAEVIKYTPKHLGITRQQYTESEGFMMKRYRYTVKTRFVDKVTGETKEYFTNVITDTEQLPWHIEEQASNAIDVMTTYGTLDLEDRFIVAAYHRKGETWQ
ncbi:MAG: hypothetical protein GWN93_20855 [Deltaproteobacteria bacterium]|nr:hypothetical protein [Deltaproteobacteria bacterium]